MDDASGWLNLTVPPAPIEKLSQVMIALPVFWSMTVLLAPVLVIDAVPSVTWPPAGWAAAIPGPRRKKQLVPRRSVRTSIELGVFIPDNLLLGRQKLGLFQEKCNTRKALPAGGNCLPRRTIQFAVHLNIGGRDSNHPAARRHRARRIEGFVLKRRRTGGQGGIRTLERLLTVTHFPGVRLKPLGHLSGTPA